MYGYSTVNYVFFQIPRYAGELECSFEDQTSHHFTTFDGNSTYHREYAQCSGWRKEDTNKIRIYLNGKEYFTDANTAMKTGPHPYSGTIKLW